MNETERFRRRGRFATTSAHELWSAVGASSKRRAVMKVARTGDVMREAEMLRLAQGDGVVGVLATPDARTLVIEHVPGPTLAHVLERRALRSQEVHALARRLGDVLARMHEAGVVHGDITPDNVMVGPGFEHAILVDFDASRAKGSPFGPRVTAEFAAPERLVGACLADPRADVFSLGALLIACRMQRSPFEDLTRDATVLRVLVFDPSRPKGADAAEARALRSMLAKEPSLRPSDTRVAVSAMFGPTEARSPMEELRVGVVRAGDADVPYAALAPGLRSALALDADVPFEDACDAIRPLLSADLVDIGAAIIAPGASPPSRLAPVMLDPALLRARKHRAALALTEAITRRAPLRVRGHLDAATREVVDALGGPASHAPRSRVLPPPSRGATREPTHARAIAHALGGAFDEDIFAAVMGIHVDESVSVLEALLAERSVTRDAEAYCEEGAACAAAYEALTERDRTHLHARIAAALAALSPEAHGERAAQLGLAGSSLRAAHEYDLAAQASLEASDLAATARWLDKAEGVLDATAVTSASKLLRGLVDLRRAQLQRWTGENAGAGASARAALARLPAGSSAWCEALGERATAAGKLGDRAEVLAVATGLRVAPISEQAAFAWDRACARAAVQLFFHGEVTRARALTRLFLKRTVRESGKPDSRRRGLSPGALVTEAIFFGRLDEYLVRLRAGVAQFEALGDERSVCMYGASVGYAYAQLGDYARAEQSLRGVVTRARAAELPMLVTLAHHNLGFVLAHRPNALDEGIAMETAAIETFRKQSDLRFLAGSLAYRARMRVAKGDASAAEKDAREAVEIGTRVAGVAPLALGVLAEALLASRRPDEALQAALDAKKAITHAGPGESYEALTWLTSARALAALGRREDALREARDACAHIRARSRSIRSPRWRARFLRNAPDHAETFALAAALRAASRS